jgi:hypothetical protein
MMLIPSKMDMSDWLALLSAAFGTITFLSGIWAWHTSTVRKQVQQERELIHINNAILQLSTNFTASLLAIEGKLTEKFQDVDNNHARLRDKLDSVLLEIHDVKTTFHNVCDRKE